MAQRVKGTYSGSGSYPLNQFVSDTAVKSKAEYRRARGILDQLQGGGFARSGKGVDEEVGRGAGEEV
jgi:hypothetical protein